TNVLDVLKRVPGITVNTGANGRGGEIRMRGLGAGYTQILVNGERAPAGFSIDSLAPDSIERIEVLRAASAEFSTQSVAGTINIILKRSVKN
ncbi:TonB-dependent receptor plug domain-containing protein, partial [Escherichia coli]|uniref:TonB-dependent receptor plug domain-containing protein n=1 Tax=Escherichia coli TaxID=562 RepID=UPI00359374B2